MADEKVQNLDGKTPIKATPFDAHDQAVRGSHAPTSADSPDKDAKTVVEFPKAVDHVDHPYQAGHKEPIVVNSAEEEAAYHENKANAETEVEVESDDKSAS